MATKLPVNTGGYAVGKKLWEMHQKDEQKHVNNYKEGWCWRCEKKKAVAATLFHVCPHCRRNRGKEFTLVTLADKGWDMCFFCGRYGWDIKQINARLCFGCFDIIRRTMKKFHKAGGTEKVDPFWKSMKRKHGDDWSIIMSDPSKSYRR